MKELLPDADIVYDHFHVIKLMNERMNPLRRSTMNKLEDEQKKELKPDVRNKFSTKIATEKSYSGYNRFTLKRSG